MSLLGAIVGALIVLGVGYFAVRTQRNKASADRDQRTLAAMQHEDATDGIDEDNPMFRDIVQAARDRGEV